MLPLDLASAAEPRLLGSPLASRGAMLDEGDGPGLFLASQERLDARADSVELSMDGPDGFLARLALSEVSYQSLRQVRMANGQTVTSRETFQAFSLDITVQSDSEEGLAAALEKLKDYYSPEKTANRIFSFATMGKDGATDEERQAWADFILPFIEQGFSEARQILGALPPEVASIVDETHDRILDLFRRFVEVGRAAALDPGLAPADTVTAQDKAAA